MSGLDYEAEEFAHAETPDQLKALGSEIRIAILDLLNERAASVTELAEALDRHADSIVAANKLDLASGEQAGLSAPMLDRLLLDAAAAAGGTTSAAD